MVVMVVVDVLVVVVVVVVVAAAVMMVVSIPSQEAPLPVTHGSCTTDTPLIPSQYASAKPPRAADSKLGEQGCEFFVAFQFGLAAFFHCGPQWASEYNFHTVRCNVQSKFVQCKNAVDGSTDFRTASLSLTDLGERVISLAHDLGKDKTDAVLSRLVYQRELRCTGRSENGEHPNCQRRCCLGTARTACDPACEALAHARIARMEAGGGAEDDVDAFLPRYHLCGAQILITATIEDVRNGEFRVRLMHDHVAPGVLRQSVPPQGRAVMPHRVAQAANTCMALNTFPVPVVNNLRKEQGHHPDASTNAQPTVAQVRGSVKRKRRKGRGDSSTDEGRIDELVRTKLIPAQAVLLYRPGEIIVMSAPCALEAAFEGRERPVASDAKVDTVTGGKVKWSTIRGKTREGVWVPYAIWIAEKENAQTVELATRALQKAVRCEDPNCPHTWRKEYKYEDDDPEQPGSPPKLIEFRMERMCERPAQERFCPAYACVDKHYPSIIGFRKVFGVVVLCMFHCLRCVDNKLKKMKVLGKAATQMTWAFRLIRCAHSHEHATIIAKSATQCLMRGACGDDRMWTVAQAKDFIEYLREWWLFPAWLRATWCAYGHAVVNASFVLCTTGAQEGAHALFDKFITGNLFLKVVSQAVLATVGATDDPQASVFADSDRMVRERKDKRVNPHSEATLREMRAYLQFLWCMHNGIDPTSPGSLRDPAATPRAEAQSQRTTTAPAPGRAGRSVASAERSVASNTHRTSAPHAGAESVAPQALDGHGVATSFTAGWTPVMKFTVGECLVGHADPHQDRRDPDGSFYQRSAFLDEVVNAVIGPAYRQCPKGYYPVSTDGYGCGCNDALWRGKWSVLGPCKHQRLRILCERAELMGWSKVEAEVLNDLGGWIFKREMSKPEHERNAALVDAVSGEEYTTESLLAVLAANDSVGPTGKSSDALLDRVESSIDPMGREASERLSCIYAAGAGILGFEVGPPTETGIEVISFCRLDNGMRGHASHTGEDIRCGDVITHVNGVIATRTSLGCTPEDARARAPAGDLVLHFTRRSADTAAHLPLVGQSKNRPAKTQRVERASRSGRRAPRTSLHRTEGGLGGNPQTRTIYTGQRPPATTRTPQPIPAMEPGEEQQGMAFVLSSNESFDMTEDELRELERNLKDKTYLN